MLNARYDSATDTFEIFSGAHIQDDYELRARITHKWARIWYREGRLDKAVQHLLRS